MVLNQPGFARQLQKIVEGIYQKRLFFITLPVAAFGTVISINTAQAQEVSSDGTLSTTVTKSADNLNFTINNGNKVGGNLFHSFKEFSVPNNGSAVFQNDVDVRNIIGRVTGGLRSDINGLIKAQGNANLFLLNPAGILFGPNAKLNIGGSFFASTANSLLFDGGVEFSATDLQTSPLLTVNIPVGLSFRSNPGEIKVSGQGSGIAYERIKETPRPRVDSSVTGLEVKEGKTLAFVGGNVSIEGGVLRAPAGRIEIGSVGGNSRVNLVPVTEGWKLGYEGVPSFFDIQMSGKSFVSATGVGGGFIALKGKLVNLTDKSILIADTLGDRNGGEISIQGDSIILNETDASNNTFGSGNAGKIKLVANNSMRFENLGGVGNHTSAAGKAGEITLEANSILIRNQSGAGSNSYKDATGDAGQINIKTNSLIVEVQSGFGTDSYGQGNAGQINIGEPNTKVGDIVFRDSSGMGSNAKGEGNAGQININADSLQIEKSGFNTDTESKGNAGEININVRDMVMNNSGISSKTQPKSEGNAGQINITGDSLLLENKSNINSSTESKGDAGEIKINVRDIILQNYGTMSNKTSGSGNAGKINITGNSFLIENYSGFNSDTQSTGNAGEMNINVRDIILQNHSGMSNKTSGSGNAGKINITGNSFLIENDSGFSSGTKSEGDAGEININVSSLVLRNTSGMDTKTSGKGSAGEININAESLAINNNSGIETSTEGKGNAGTLNVTAKTINLNNGRLRVESKANASGNAGTLNVVADTIRLDNQSVIIATATSSNGGNLRLDVAKLLLLRRNSQISAKANGNGGNITINAPDGLIIAFPLENSDITADASGGQGGKIAINSAGIFGLVQRTRAELERLGVKDLDPKNLSTNDITAFSAQKPSLDGTVSIQTPETDPSRGLVELPETVIDPKQQVAQNPCQQGAKNEFVVTGRGGLPPSPNETLSSDNTRVDLVSPVAMRSGGVGEGGSGGIKKNASVSKPIVPAQGWVLNDKGEVVLTAYNPTSSESQRYWQTSAACGAR
ncbi:MAG: filamentous hemagglutinin N-terminal domain-containing protein [Heteroscytonema crispum UTEX LB 1556]